MVSQVCPLAQLPTKKPHDVRHWPCESQTCGGGQPLALHDIALSGTHPKGDPDRSTPLPAESPMMHCSSAAQLESVEHAMRHTLRTHTSVTFAQRVGLPDDTSHGPPG